MKLEGSERIGAPRERVYRALQDPEVLRACTPGAERLEESEPDRFEATLEVRLPAVTGRFDGHVRIAERTPPERMRLELAGKGTPGFVQGTAELALEEAGEATEVAWSADVQIGGQVARLGQRMLSGIAKEMAGQFFEALERALAAPVPARAAPSPLRAALQLLWRTLKNLLGLSKRS